ncbi:hypothetical protein ACFQX7_12345 [Luedemannella flava]|uniref:hypothetical protein n=1 Tax=Luedemannella flava TaxID=349316 RepID=UPI0031DA6C41
MSTNDGLVNLIALLGDVEAHQVGERLQRVFFPRSLADDESISRLNDLADLWSVDDPSTRFRALRIAAEIVRGVATESLTVERCDSDPFQSWLRRLEHVAIRDLSGSDLGYHGASVLVLYWLGVLAEPESRTMPNGDFRRHLENYVEIGDGSPLRLAAAVALARLSAGTGLPHSAARLFREFLAGSSLPGDTCSEVLGDVRTAIRIALDGLPDQTSIFVQSCQSSVPLARFQNIGQCLRLMETWRDAPAHVLPAVAERLRDREAPVRMAAVSVVHRSGQAAAEYLNELSETLRDPTAGMNGPAQPRLVDLLRAEALATLVSFGRTDALEALRSYLSKPYGNVQISSLVADARFFAAEVVTDIANVMRAGVHAEASVETIRALSGVLDGLVTWGSGTEPFLPEMAALLRSKVAESAVLDVLAELGPAVVAVEDLLLDQLRSGEATPGRRAAAAAALLRGGLASADEAAAVLASMLDRLGSPPAAVRYLADLDFPPAVLGSKARIGVVEKLLTESRSSVVRASSARVLWKCGERRPGLAEALMREVGPCPNGIRCVEWLADMGQIAGTCYSALLRIKNDRRRARCLHAGDLVVAADERYQVAIAQALSVVP